MNQRDQRVHERVGVNEEFETIDAFLSEYVSNVSLGGVFIRSRSPLPIGTTVQLVFTLVVDEVETIEGEGRVVRVTDHPVPGMAVEFSQLTPRSEALLRTLAERGGRKLVAVLDG